VSLFGPPHPVHQIVIADDVEVAENGRGCSYTSDKQTN